MWKTVLRASLGALFVGHGTQKLFGWFGGGGLEETATSFERLGLRPGRANALAAGVAETTGGALLAAGLATPLAAASLTGTMLTAVKRVHRKNGLWTSNGGFEYHLVLVAALLSLVELGPGGRFARSRTRSRTPGVRLGRGDLERGRGGCRRGRGTRKPPAGESG